MYNITKCVLALIRFKGQLKSSIFTLPVERYLKIIYKKMFGIKRFKYINFEVINITIFISPLIPLFMSKLPSNLADSRSKSANGDGIVQI